MTLHQRVHNSLIFSFYFMVLCVFSGVLRGGEPDSLVSFTYLDSLDRRNSLTSSVETPPPPVLTTPITPPSLYPDQDSDDFLGSPLGLTTTTLFLAMIPVRLSFSFFIFFFFSLSFFREMGTVRK